MVTRDHGLMRLFGFHPVFLFETRRKALSLKLQL